MKHIKLADKYDCTGCGACSNACPTKAISMQSDENGFLHPVIAEEKCIKCQKCVKSCPVIENPPLNPPSDDVYAAWADDALRLNSSSGGVFSVIAFDMIRCGGFVCGAVWDDDKRTVKHIITDIPDDVQKMQGSKYVQSNLGDIYSRIQTLLKQGKIVLFTGTPCQVAGLHKFLGKSYNTLLSIDLVCFGVPSAAVLSAYMKDVTHNERTQDTIIDINFRDKSAGWSPDYLMHITTLEQDIKKQGNDNLFHQAFISGLSVRSSCKSCPFANRNRTGDITLGDFWWVEQYKKVLNDRKGTSLVLVNNAKGKKLITGIKDQLQKLEKVPFRYVSNKTLFKPSQTHANRDLFFSHLNTKPFSENVMACLTENFDIAIINFWWAVTNYGALLTGYALQQFLERAGYNTRLIDNKYMNYKTPEEYEGSFNEKFRNKYLKTTRPLITDEDYRELASHAKIFITGSDQVFNLRWMGPHFDNYFLNFTNVTSKKVAFSASFGIGEDEFSYDPSTITDMENALKSFDFISVREDAGVDICRHKFNVNATQIIDPVFLLNRQDYQTIADNSRSDYSDKIVSYVLDSNERYEVAYQKLEEKYGCKVEKIQGRNLSAEEWLAAISGCKYFITDSFHGLCFALIFNKQFACICNRKRGYSRFSSMLNLFPIPRLYDDIDACLAQDHPFVQCDQAIVEGIIRHQQDIAIKTFSAVLQDPNTNLENKLQLKIWLQEKQIKNMYRVLSSLYQEPKIRKKRLKYKILSKLFPGKKGQKYKQKYKEIKNQLYEIKKILAEG